MESRFPFNIGFRISGKGIQSTHQFCVTQIAYQIRCLRYAYCVIYILSITPRIQNARIWALTEPSRREQHRRSLPVENEGLSTRDFIYVKDIVDGLLACAETGGSGEVYNLASGTETSIRELAETINDMTGNRVPVQFLPRRDWDTSGKRFGSKEKAKRELNFEAKVNLRDGLSETIEWTRNNLASIERCIQKHAHQMGGNL